jgi:hypothetical protein
MNSGPRRTLFGNNSGSAAGNRPRNTTINPAANDPLTRNPAFLDPVSGVQVNGPAPATGAFSTTGRSLITGGGPDDATALQQLVPPYPTTDFNPWGPENVLTEPATTDFGGNESYDAQNFPNPVDSGVPDSGMVDETENSYDAAEAVDGAFDSSGATGGSGASLRYAYPGADADLVLPGTTMRPRQPAATTKVAGKPSLFANRQLVAERLGLNFSTNSKALTVASVPTGSWAAHVGFLPGDRIVGIGRRSVASYSDLSKYVLANPAARTSVEVQRRGKVEYIPLNLATLNRDLSLPDLSSETTASGRPIAGTAAATLRAARLRAQTRPDDDRSDAPLPVVPQ